MVLRTTFSLLLIGFLLGGCASLTVTKVDIHPDAHGVRYSLPKPVLQAVPQSDGTIAVDVLYLPDSNETYAIDTSSWGSSYTFQIAITQNGLLGAVEFKEDTSAVGQQLVATAGAAAAQYQNIQNAQLVAAQTAVNTAQAAADTAKATADGAQAQVKADIDNGALPATLNADKATAAQAQAKYQDAQAVLDRTKNTAVAVTTTATTGTLATSTNPTLGTTGFGPQQWAAPTLYETPRYNGAVLYAINDHFVDGKEVVSLDAQTFPQQKVGGKVVVGAAKQQIFATTTLGLGAPTLSPQNLTFQLADGPITFTFSRAITKIKGSNVTAQDGKIASNTQATLDPNDLKTLTQSINGLKAGSYQLDVTFIDDNGIPREIKVKFTLV